MTKLDAVNIVLTRNGRAPVSALDTSAASEAAHAEQLIDEVELRIQAEGWPYNTRSDVELEAADDGQIDLPTGCITIDAYGQDAWRHVSQNGGHLYDHDNNTSTFTGTIRVQYTLRLGWGCIPYPVRDLIAARAAVTYNERYGRDPQRVAGLMLEDSRARTRAEQHAGRTGNINVLQTPEAARVRGGDYLSARRPIWNGGFNP